MPELPEVETVRAALELQLVGRRIVDVMVYNPNLRRPVDPVALAECCRGRPVKAVRRRGKYLLVECGREWVMVVHLGMTGRFRIGSVREPVARHEHIVWQFADGHFLSFSDPRRFGLVIATRLPLPENGDGPLPKLGPEPLSRDFTLPVFYAALRKRQSPIKNVLLDQSVVAGIGNIYAVEALFLAGIDPRRRADRISRHRCQALIDAIRSVLSDAILCGGTTISDFRSVDGLAGSFTVCLQAYGKAGKPCPKCGESSLLERVVMAGRSTYFCRSCQR